MMKILSIISKNFKILMNAKFSSIIFILGPLILMLLVGSVLSDTSIKNVNAGIYTGGGTNSFSDGFISSLQSNSFNVIRESTLIDCKNAVLDGKNDVCIDVEPANFASLGGQYSSGYNLKLYVDFSQERIVWSIIATIQKVAGEESQTITNQRINALKVDSSNLFSQLGNQQSELNQIISNLNLAEISLQNANGNQQGVNYGINQSLGQLSTVQSNLNSIASAGILGSPYDSELSNSIASISSAEADLNNINGQNTEISTALSLISGVSSSLQSTSSTLSQMQNDIQGIQNSDLQKITNPVSVSYYSILDSEGGSIKKNLQSFDYIFPSFLMFFILLSSLIYTTIDIMRERTSNAYIRNMASKANGFDFMFSSFFTSVVVVFIQIAAILVLASFFVNLSLFSNIPGLFLFLLISISFFCLVGLVLGMLFSSYESSIVGAISLSLLFFMFSSIIAPVETLPKALSSIISFSPFALLESKARFLLIFNSPLSFSIAQSAVLLATVLVLGVLGALFFRRSREKEI